MIAIDVDGFVAGLDAMAAALPAVVDQYASAVANDGFNDMKSTTSFQNRTGALRDSMSIVQEGDFWRLFLDSSALSRAPGKGSKAAPPVVYGAYLNNGTTRISARRFMEHAAETVALSSLFSVDDVIGAWAGGAY